MSVESSQRIASGRIAKSAEWPEFEAIEYGTQINEERVVSWAGKNLDPAGKIVNCLRCKIGFIVRCRTRSDVVRWNDKTGAEHGGGTTRTEDVSGQSIS